MISVASLPTGRPGRLLALSLATFVLALVYVVLVQPLLDLYAAQEAMLDQRRALAARLDAVDAGAPALRERLTALRSSAKATKITLDGASDAIASAGLGSRAAELAASAGATVISTDSLPGEPRGPYRRVGIRIALNGTYEAVARLLASLETATPPLVIDNLVLRSVTGKQGSPDNPGITAGMEIFGFRAPDAPTR